MAKGETLHDSSWNDDLPWGDGGTYDPDALQNIPGFVALDVLPPASEEPTTPAETGTVSLPNANARKKEWS